ncbi:RNA polymerase sigma factor [Granulosicoccus sp.]|nr:RNA polymerase sigma factor [Granulosicoccus sp.]MDB4224731.1 RNA polymerase sigma factor [Granulosicoccus sp.]
MFDWNKPADIRTELSSIYPRIWRYALVLTATRDRADDLAQAACLRAMERQKQFEPGTDLVRWVFRITHNLWINELRKEAVRRRNGLGGVELSDVIDTSQDIEKMGQQRELMEHVLHLPEAQRQTVVLTYVEGYSYKEVADILEIPIGTVMSRLATARKTLTKRYKNNQGVQHVS